jgi:ABC-2 type transport system ATP-binding protein
MGAQPLICVRELGKSYERTRAMAVDGLSFEVEAGTILGMVGPNGAGKTTTLKALAGIIAPTRGELLVNGHSVTRDPVAAKRQLAFVPDDPKLFDLLTVWEHLQFVASAYRVPSFAAVAEPLLERFELADRRDVLAQSLSRGMRQKVAICCAYLHEPTVLLFDEPMTGLDPRGIRTLKESIRQRAQAGAAVVISSHMLSLIDGLCTQLLIMHRGRRLFLGTLDEARRQYPTLRDDASLEDIFFEATGDKQ